MNHAVRPLTALPLICLAASPLAAPGAHELPERFEAAFVLDATS